MKPIWSVARLATAVAPLSLGACGVIDRGFLNAAGPVADQTRGLFFLVCLILVFVLAPVFVLTPIIIWHYRLSNTEAAYRPNWKFNWPLEGLIWIPPTIIVIVLAVFLWRDTHRLDPYRRLPSTQPATEVQAVALDWKWLFIYPDEGVASVNQLVFPADRPVHFSLTSATVMQSFFVPRLGGQIYAMAGMTTHHNLAATAPGTSWGENTQFNGTGFQSQKFEVLAKTPDAYKRWIGALKADGRTLDIDSFKKLSARKLPAGPIRYGAVAPGLFQSILDLSAPGTGDASKHSGDGQHE